MALKQFKWETIKWGWGGNGVRWGIFHSERTWLCRTYPFSTLNIYIHL
jgi:hypothetical protein